MIGAMMRNKLIMIGIIVSISLMIMTSAFAVEYSQDDTITVSDALTMTDNVVISVNKVKTISDTLTIADG